MKISPGRLHIYSSLAWYALVSVEGAWAPTGVKCVNRVPAGNTSGFGDGGQSHADALDRSTWWSVPWTCSANAGAVMSLIFQGTMVFMLVWWSASLPNISLRALQLSMEYFVPIHLLLVTGTRLWYPFPWRAPKEEPKKDSSLYYRLPIENLNKNF